MHPIEKYSDITTLEHEVGDDSVENGVLVVKSNSLSSDTLFTSAQASEVLSSLGNNIIEKLHLTVRKCQLLRKQFYQQADHQWQYQRKP